MEPYRSIKKYRDKHEQLQNKYGPGPYRMVMDKYVADMWVRPPLDGLEEMNRVTLGPQGTWKKLKDQAKDAHGLAMPDGTPRFLMECVRLLVLDENHLFPPHAQIVPGLVCSHFFTFRSMNGIIK